MKDSDPHSYRVSKLFLDATVTFANLNSRSGANAPNPGLPISAIAFPGGGPKLGCSQSEESDMKNTVAVIGLSLLLVLTVAAENPYQITQVLREVSSGDDVVTTFLANYTFEGRLLNSQAVEMDVNRDGTMDRRTTATYSHDQEGNRVLTVFETYDISDGRLESRTRVSNAYDVNGRVVQGLVETDSNGDGTIDSVSRTTFTYNSDGNRVLQVQEVDSDDDGAIEGISKTTFSYDTSGNLVRRLIESDADADGSTDSTSTHIYAYDARGNLLSEVREDDGDRDGKADFTLATRYTLDARGNAVLVVSDIDWDGDAVIDETSTRASTFNKRGQLLSSTTEYQNPDVSFYATATTTYTYDNHGNVVRIMTEHKVEGDESLNQVETVSYTYGRVTGSR